MRMRESMGLGEEERGGGEFRVLGVVFIDFGTRG